MATVTSLTTTYAGKVAGGYIRQAFLANETLQNITVKENIDYRQVVRKLVDNITFSGATCDFTPTGTVTLTEREIVLEKFQVQRELCKKDFLADWDAAQAQNGQLPGSLSDALIDNMLAGISAKNESLIWTGVNGNAGEYDGFLTLFDADGTVNKVATPVAIDSSNVIAKVKLLIAELPTAVKRATEKPVIYMANNVWEAYMYAQVGSGYATYITNGPAVQPTFMGMYNIAVCPGMPDNAMVMAQPSNLWFGTNVLNDWNNISVLDMEDRDLSENVRFSAKFFAAVQYGFGNEIAVYAQGIS
jgi:hypothetical protein